MTIIAVDNQRERLTHLEKCLKAVFPGETIVIFTDALLAAKYNANYGADVVFTEVLMRRANGYELASLILKRSQNAKIIFIADDEGTIEELDKSFAAGCLVRPVTEGTIRALFKSRLTTEQQTLKVRISKIWNINWRTKK